MFFNESNGLIYISDGYWFQLMDPVTGEIVSMSAPTMMNTS